MINLKLRLSVSVLSFLSVSLFSPPSAVSDSLQPLGDFTTSHPQLIPFAKCTVNGKSLLAAKNAEYYYEDQEGPITLLDANNYPNDAKVIKRFSESTYFNSGSGLLEDGCFAASNGVWIPKGDGILLIDRANKDRFIPYPAGFSSLEYAFSVNGVGYVVGGHGELLQVDSLGALRWVLEPLSGYVRRRYFSAPHVLTFLTSDKSIETDLKTFKRTVKPQFAIQAGSSFPLPYFSGPRGKLMIVPPQEEFGDYRVAVGDGSVQGSFFLEHMFIMNAQNIDPVRVGDRIYFVANDYEIWSTDGSKSGTRIVYKGSPDDGFPELLTSYQGRLIVGGSRLVALTPGGSVTTLASSRFSQVTKTEIDSAGRLLLLGNEIFVRTNGTPSGTMIVEDSNIHSDGRILSLKDRVLLSLNNSTYRVDRGALEEVPYVDTTVTNSSRGTNVGQVGNSFYFSIKKSGVSEIYKTEGTSALTRGAFEISSPYVPQPIGTLGGALHFATGAGDLYSYRAETAVLDVRPFEGRSSDGYLDIRSEGFPSGSGLAFMTDEGLFKVDAGTSTAKLVKALPSDANRAFGFSSHEGSLYFTVASRDANWRSVFTPWRSDGTAKGTSPLTTKIANRKPHVGFVNKTMGVYYSDSSGVEKLIWRAEDYEYDGCSADPKVYEIDGSYYIHGRCEGLFAIASDFSSTTLVAGYDVVWSLQHRGYVYFAHKADDGRGVVSRIGPGRTTPELVYVLDESLSLSRSEAKSLGDRILMWLTSEHIGTEPFVLLDGVDECPADPLKATAGVCGCGVADSDLDSNNIVDCKELADKCPRDPNKTTPGFCGCGIADTDVDKNGRPDCLENCRMGSYFPGCNPYGTPTPQPY